VSVPPPVREGLKGKAPENRDRLTGGVGFLLAIALVSHRRRGLGMKSLTPMAAIKETLHQQRLRPAVARPKEIMLFILHAFHFV